MYYCINNPAQATSYADVKKITTDAGREISFDFVIFGSRPVQSNIDHPSFRSGDDDRITLASVVLGLCYAEGSSTARPISPGPAALGPVLRQLPPGSRQVAHLVGPFYPRPHGGP